MSIRKSVRALSDNERNAFIDALLALKGEASAGMSGVSTYDTYVVWHVRAMTNVTQWNQDSDDTNRNSAHRGPAFLPWHREFLRRFEADLQRVSNNSNLAIPYWDWENDSAFPAFLGGDGTPVVARRSEPQVHNVMVVRNQEPMLHVKTYFMAVSEGPFRFDQVTPTNGWLAVNGNGTPVGPLQRAFGAAEVPEWDSITGLPVWDLVTNQPVTVPVTMPTKQDVQHALGIGQYDAAPWDDSFQLQSFRNVLEGWWRGPRLHNQVHTWVGGSMVPGTSPNDPVFFLHHCNVDRLWAEWQTAYPMEEYQPQSGGPPGHNVGDLMFPWDGVATTDRVRPQDVLSLGSVTYAPPP